MFEALTESIQTLDIPPVSPAVVEVAQQHATLTAKLTMALAEIDATGQWEIDGSASMVAWMRVHLQVTNQQASRLLKTGRRLRDLPGTRDAWIGGRLSPGQVEVIVANVTDRRAPLWVDHETDLVPLLAANDVTDTITVMRDWAAKADAILDTEAPAVEAAAEVHFATTLNGRGYLNATFDSEHAEIIGTGLRLADSGDLDQPAATRQGQAMVDVFRFFLDHQADQLGKRHRPHLNIVITHDHLRDTQPGRTLSGVPLPGLVMRKLACDANIHRVITHGTSSILDYGRATRTIPPALYTSLVLRDRGCRFPGCDRPPHWCEGHHLLHWEDGGPTNLTNLALLCSKHHHVIHQPGWHIRLDPTGTIEVADPNGRRHASHPPGTLAA